MLARCEHAARWSAREQISGTMDSHLLAVSGVSSCSQRSQVESNKAERGRAAYASQTRRARTIKKKKGIRLRKLSDAYLPASHAGPNPILLIGGRGVA